MAMNFITTILSEGQSLVEPPLFNGENYIYWKKRMKNFVLASDYGVWRTIIDGPYKPTKEEKEWDTSNMNMIQLNAKAIHTLFRTLDDKDYKRVSKCESTKEIWQKLEELYEETKKEEELEENLCESL
ncbi:Uncharacterized protein TCM_033687 [Theobroma cacao]|uniref:DUF4219 domain-containing protein n=1 Tax=Theobroma cacao TaxID=3641 RepID=A0A061FBN6_THECC|nr:Uncharacterized protein TCM_033687 [Theobroma cacao]